MNGQIKIENFDGSAIAEVAKVKSLKLKKGETIEALLERITETERSEIREKIKEVETENAKSNPHGHRTPLEVLRHRSANPHDEELSGVETKDQARAFLQRIRDNQRSLQLRSCAFIKERIETIYRKRIAVLVDLHRQASEIEERFMYEFGIESGESDLTRAISESIEETACEHDHFDKVAERNPIGVFNFAKQLISA